MPFTSLSEKYGVSVSAKMFATCQNIQTKAVDIALGITIKGEDHF